MKTNNMRERITFVSFSARENDLGVVVADSPHDEFSVWAEVPKVPLREANDPNTELGIRTQKPTFIVRFLTQTEVQPEWAVRWHAKLFDITGLDPDYQRRDITTITTKERSVK
jgi:head-tail adaptor